MNDENSASTERLEQAERALREANTFLDAIVENIPDMIFVKRAEDHAFIRFNRAGEKLLGWTRKELIGKTDHDFYPKEQADFFHQKDRETLQNNVLVDVPEEPIQTKAHGLRWLHTRKVPVLDEQGRPKYLLGISEDITERKATEERARALEHEVALMAANAREAMASWTTDGIVTAWNPAAEQLSGVLATAAIGARLESLLPDGSFAKFTQAMEHLKTDDAAPLFSVTFQRADGREVDSEVSLFAVRDVSGAVLRFCSVSRDLTEIERLRHVTTLLGRIGGSTATPDALESPKMQSVLGTVGLVASDPRANVMLLGETGVGKGWVARRIHQLSARAPRPFFEVNCASLSSNLVESELFGHDRGAFTGASTQKRGIVEAAEGGTLFLDEVGELPLGVQAQLLTFLDSRTFRRVGGTRTLTADVRLLTATNVDLKRAVERGTFRRDLFYRLNVVPIEIPPLRERKEEIPGLALGFAVEFSKRNSSTHRVSLSRQVSTALKGYPWPGNIREMRNAIERAIILSRGERIELEHLPPEIRGVNPADESPRLEDVERRHIFRILEEVQQNRTRAAEVLGISRSTLKRKLAEYGIAE